MENLNNQTLFGKASIVSAFDFGQEVWFLNGRHIMNGTVVAIKGSKHCYYAHEDIELEIKYTNGEMGCNFWVKEEDVFKTKEYLINTILNQ
jgi:hypothetical protein